MRVSLLLHHKLNYGECVSLNLLLRNETLV